MILGIGSRIKHEKLGVGVVTNVTAKLYWITFIESGLETLPTDEDFEIIEAVEDEVDTVSFYEVERIFKKLLEKYSDISQIVPLAEKWRGGVLTLNPSDASMKSKEIPIESFFHKIVMVRDRVRVMEQKINSSKKLDDQEKIDLEQYITRIYGSLTTFNVLFKDSDHQFKGAGKK